MHKSTQWLTYCILPVVLGMGAAVWLFFGENLHHFRAELSQDERRAEATGAKPLPVALITLGLKTKPSDCAQIEKASIAEGEIVLYWSFRCQGGNNSFLELSWKARSPDRTILVQDMKYLISSGNLENGDRGEAKLSVNQDPRITTIDLSLKATVYNH